jgi:hypothetical protein
VTRQERRLTLKRREFVVMALFKHRYRTLQLARADHLTPQPLDLAEIFSLRPVDLAPGRPPAD